MVGLTLTLVGGFRVFSTISVLTEGFDVTFVGGFAEELSTGFSVFVGLEGRSSLEERHPIHLYDFDFLLSEIGEHTKVKK